MWYELAFCEARHTVRRGSKVWQLAFGSGFKFNSSVLVANKTGRRDFRGKFSRGKYETIDPKPWQTDMVVPVWVMGKGNVTLQGLGPQR